MTVYLEKECEDGFPFDCGQVAKMVADAVLEDAGCPYEAQVNVLITTDDEIRQINREQRGIDASTDVLSFPVADYPAPGSFSFLEERQVDCFEPDSGELMLGDIVISAEHVRAQAQEYGHSLLREYAFLIAHSALHLIGYDHMTERDEREMEEKQEKILNGLRITRENDTV